MTTAAGVRIFLPLIFLLFVAGIGINAQAVKVDELDGTSCELQRSLVDVLLAELTQSPASKGVIVIHGEHHDPITAYMQRSTIADHLRLRKFDTNRIVFVRGKSEPGFRAELWKAADNDLDSFTRLPWNLKLTELNRPILVYAESWIQGANCGFWASDLTFYSEFLTANPDLLGRVIIRDRSVGRFNKVRTRIIKELATKFKIAKSRLEFAYIQSDSPDIEYWYIPRNTFPGTTIP